MSRYAVGIDLGTTNSYVAFYKNGQVRVFENECGERMTPSSVTFKEDQFVHLVLVGNDSVQESFNNIKTTVSEVKRLIGRRFDDPEVQSYIRTFPCTVYNDLGSPKIEIDEKRKYYPEEITAFILHKLRGITEAHLGEEVTTVVVTVPAYFSEAQRQATKDAAKIAGFQKIAVINEPTAAAIAFNHQNKKGHKRNLVIYDFRAGTFDVSIVSVEKDKYQVLAVNGDCHLGGHDIDRTLETFIKQCFIEQYKRSFEDGPLKSSRRLKDLCEDAKKRLATQYNTNIELESFSGIDYATFPISRARFEQLNNELFKRTITILDDCLQESGLPKDHIDKVVLVGGSSVIYRLHEMLNDYFGKDIVNRGLNPHEAIVIGAAIHAHNLAGDKSEVVDVTTV